MPTVTSTDILDTMIEGGYAPSSINYSPDRYIDHARKVCCGLGALAIRAGIEPNRVPSMWHEDTLLVDANDLKQKLAEHYQVSLEFMEGVEDGFEDWEMDMKLKSSGDYVRGWHVGRQALHFFLRPPYEQVGMIIA